MCIRTNLKTSYWLNLTNTFVDKLITRFYYIFEHSHLSVPKWITQFPWTRSLPYISWTTRSPSLPFISKEPHMTKVYFNPKNMAEQAKFSSGFHIWLYPYMTGTFFKQKTCAKHQSLFLSRHYHEPSARTMIKFLELQKTLPTKHTTSS